MFIQKTQNMFIQEPQKTIPVKGEYDVIIAGGGVAGISAALAATRTGAKTLLIERSFMLGGLATAGLVTVYLPLCDGMGNQVSFGIVEELFRLSVQHGCEDLNADMWLNETGNREERKKHRYETQFNASVFSILCETLLQKESVEILYGTSVCAAPTENGRITAVITENKSGREAYRAKSFVDATGDADLCAYAGADTCLFGQGNVAAYWYYEYFENAYHLRQLGFADKPDKYKTEEKKANDTRKRYGGVDGKELSELTIYSHGEILKNFLSKGGVDEKHALCSIATTPQVRMTRRIDGMYTMNDEEESKFFQDSIGLVSNWRKRGPIYEIPFRCLYGKMKNLFACGRCISVADDMWDITRVIPVCAVTGQAAGTAAAMTDDVTALNVKALQSKLRADGVKLHIEEL